MDAGTILTPVLLGWPIASTLAGRALLRVGYRTMAIGGGLLAVDGTLLLARTARPPPGPRSWLPMLITGLGLGFLSMPYMLGVQNAVPWSRRGVATSSVQFFRNIGGAIAVAALGALLNARAARDRRAGCRSQRGPGAGPALPAGSGSAPDVDLRPCSTVCRAFSSLSRCSPSSASEWRSSSLAAQPGSRCTGSRTRCKPFISSRSPRPGSSAAPPCW